MINHNKKWKKTEDKSQPTETKKLESKSQLTEAKKLESKSETTEAKKLKTYTLEFVAKHDKETDCWIIIHDNVYDVTKFQQHKKTGIYNYCGKDATKIFDETTNTKIPSNKGHSNDAKNMTKHFLIGKFSK